MKWNIAYHDIVNLEFKRFGLDAFGTDYQDVHHCSSAVRLTGYRLALNKRKQRGCTTKSCLEKNKKDKAEWLSVL